ncbi:MAG: AraC family transcriptional regulator, partial [Oscillospiraceae bacterium]|nr:AraC family transcriptional regulator [Oscillospiraceae bacterium]
RALELMVVLSRAAAEGGVDIEQVFGLNYRYLAEISHLRSTDDLIFWLTRIMERFADLVFNLVDIKHKDIIYKAIDFMKKRYQSKVTLEDTALYVGLSPSYFSKVFKEEMGCTFNHYLNELRINKSKSLLLSGNATLVEICSQSGFEDQSYFTKVFKKRTGVTPGKFRERRGRLEPDKERSAD